MSDDRRCRTVGLRRPGVTLVELLVVILVMLMITAVTIPAIRPALEGRKIREAARMVEVFLNGARNRAIASGHSVGVLIEPDPDEPSQCISLSYVEQPDPYAGDYQSSTVLTLGNGGFGAWQVPPHFDAMLGFVATVSPDVIFPSNDIGWVQNIGPGDVFTMDSIRTTCRSKSRSMTSMAMVPTRRRTCRRSTP
jgi:type II secretory pathway pseudopilin PulG